MHPVPRRAPTSEAEAFGALVEEHQVAVYNLCYRMLGDPDLAEDAAQETFLRGFRSRHGLDPARPARTWLLSIAAHHCIDVLRRRARLAWLPLEDRPLPEPGPGPEESLERSEADSDLQRRLRRLGPEERAVIALRYWQNLSVEEIATVTSSSANAVRTRLYRARRTLAAADLAPQPPTVREMHGEPRAV